MRTATAVTLLLLALACSRKAERAGSSDSASAPAPAAPTIAPPELARGEAAPQSQPAPAQALAPPRMLVRNGEASVRVQALEEGMRAVKAVAQRVGGYIANERVQAGENQVRQATLQLKVPAARFDEAVTALSQVGKVESVEVTADDVGEEFVDVNARLANARRLEERLVTLLATRTGRLEDVLAVERELARVREEIDRLAGRAQYLQRQAEVSTLLVTVHEPAPLVGPPGDNRILDAFRGAWRNFVGAVAYMIELFGALIPVAAVGLALWWAVSRLRRWLRRRAAPAA